MFKYKVFVILLITFYLIISPSIGIAYEEDIPVTAVSLSLRDITLVLGQETEISATVYPLNATNQEVQWTISDPEIIEIDESDLNARIISLYPGEATITVTTIDGGYRTHCQVRVIVLVRSIGMHEEDITLNPGDSIELEAWVEPRNATDQRIAWESSDSSIAKVSEDGVVEAVKPGQARIIARSVENERITAYQTVTVEELVTVPDGTEDELIATNLDEDEAIAQQVIPFLYIALAAVIIVACVTIYFFKRRMSTVDHHGLSKSVDRPFVKGESGIFTGKKIYFTNNQIVFGRDPTVSRVVFPSEYDLISRKHCVVSYLPDTGQFNIEDFSSNGTFLINNEKLELGKEYPLKPGDQFYLAEHEEVFSVNL